MLCVTHLDRSGARHVVHEGQLSKTPRSLILADKPFGRLRLRNDVDVIGSAVSENGRVAISI